MEVSVLNQIIINSISIGAIYALLALGLTLLFSVMDILFFAHGAMYMLGAYAAFYLCTKLGLNYFLALPIGVAKNGTRVRSTKARTSSSARDHAIPLPTTMSGRSAASSASRAASTLSGSAKLRGGAPTVATASTSASSTAPIMTSSGISR